jgi:hypothetical protein
MAAKLFPYADMFKWMSYGNGTFFLGGGWGLLVRAHIVLCLIDAYYL